MLNKSVLRPVEYPYLTRLGPDGDGGYVVPEDQIENCDLLISLGLSDNWSFDGDFLARNPHVRIVGVDHTVGPLWFLRRMARYSWKLFLHTILLDGRKREKYSAKLRNAAGYFTFFRDRHKHLKKKVSNENRGSSITLGHIIDSSPSRSKHRDVFLKMDIEGAEYEVWPDIVTYRDRIRCIVAEFHDLDTKTGDFNECMQALLVHFSVVHVHGNNGADYDQSNDFPSVVEMTLVNRSLLDKALSFSKREYPRTELDYPNNPAVSEYRLSFEQPETFSASR